MRNRTLLAVGAACVALAGAGAAVATAVDEPDQPTPGSPQTPVASVQDGLAGSLAIFERDRVGADTVPARLADTLGKAKPDGINPELARRAFVRGETTGFVIPSQTGVCLFLVRPQNDAGGCDTKELEGPATTFYDGRPVIYGLVPDDVEAVTISFADGGTSQVKTEANTYYVEVPAGSRPTTVSFGDVVHDVYVPDVAALERRAAAALEAAKK